jgi:hypothetical protein
MIPLAPAVWRSARSRWRSLDLSPPGYAQWVYALVLVWGTGDALSTLLAAATAGPGMEANPWMRLLLEHEPLLLPVVKGAIVLYAGVVLLACRPLVRRVPGWRLWFGGVVAAGLVVTATNLAVGIVAVV